MDDHRILWTTYKNLRSWFHNCMVDLVELGFATRENDGSVEITDEQLNRITNLGETCLSMGGSKGKRGG